MERLAVHRLSHGKPPVVILQYPGMDTGDIVLAAPLYPAGAAMPMEIITPEVALNGDRFILGVHLLAGIRKSSLEGRMGDLLAYEYEISRALSRLFFGN